MPQGQSLFAERERQSREAATFAADAYHARLRVLDTMMQEKDGPFLAGSQATIADCIAMATLQFAEHVYGVPVPNGCRELGDWYAFFASRPSAVLPSYPKPLVTLAHGLPALCPPTSA
ncbi:glutathione S-transferase family protein [Sphingomonas sp. PL-96]|uniref:glutathione S-transferase family protein n=1 Tax=Sphingomonas sp. PL-96 TaxID=2887201 RepID=UPI001E2CC40D|nr:glutathione S-transferase family protein [Sphingomonas sp. PL-96]MCC2976671.1 glutathione S-transferase family protein [Sphingomonas sp. PL-96]